MAWPTNKPDSNRFQLPESSIALSRPELKIMSDAVNDIVDFIDTTGISNGYILQYNSTSGQLEAVPNTGGSETNIQAGAGITISKDDSAGQHEVAFSGVYTTGFTEYRFSNFSTLGISSSGSVPQIESQNSLYPGINIKTHSSYVGFISLQGGNNGNILVEPHGTGKVRLHNAYNMPTADGTSGQVIQTDGSGNLTFATVSGGAGGDTQIEAAPNGNITVTQPDSGGAFTISLAEPLNNPINANNNQISNPVFRGYNEHINTTLGTSGTLTPDVADGNVAVITLSGNITINGFSGVANGDSMTFIIKQPASGGPYTLSSTMKFAGGNKTLSTAANAIDVLSVIYDGTDYIASLSTNFS